MTSKLQRSVFFVSDSTGLTSQKLGNSLLEQFPEYQFDYHIFPYVDNEAKAFSAVQKINAAAISESERPLVIETIINQDIRKIIGTCNGFMLDVLDTFLKPLEQELGVPSSHMVGRAHGLSEHLKYKGRIDAMNFALDNDDGAKITRYDEAELILVGVSRSGKTPTCIYLALQGGVFAANYPMTEEDLTLGRLPKPLEAFKDRLYGLTIDPKVLSAIRNERKANSHYASLMQCEDEVRVTEMMFQRYGIPYIDTTQISVEEIATRILLDTGLRGHKN